MSAEANLLTLGLMTKYWDAGKVKTRLGATVGMARAAALHRLFVAHLCASLAEVADRNLVCLSPDHSVDRFATSLRSWGLDDSWGMLPQGEGDLGARMQRWFAHCLAADQAESEKASRAILIGADCPGVDAGLIRQAGELLNQHDAVLGPAADGGYYLIGLRGPWESRQASFEQLFVDVPWSTQHVLEITQQRLRQAELSFALLDLRVDVDTVVELEQLRESLRDESSGPQPTAAARLRAEIEQVMSDLSFPTSSGGQSPTGIRNE